MTNPLPIGNSQTLQFNSMALQLDACDFMPDDYTGLAGYKRILQQQSVPEYAWSIFGEANIKANYAGPRYSFKWALQLPTEKWLMLKAMQEAQLEAFANRASDVRIILTDRRLLQCEPIASRKRAKHLPDPSGIQVPNGMIAFWPKFAIGFDADAVQEFGFVMQNGVWLNRIVLSAVELTLLPPQQFDS